MGEGFGSPPSFHSKKGFPLASIPKAPEPLKIYQVTVTGKRGKNPPTVTFAIESSTPKAAQREAMNALLSGKWTVTAPEADAETSAAPAAARARRGKAAT